MVFFGAGKQIYIYFAKLRHIMYVFVHNVLVQQIIKFHCLCIGLQNVLSTSAHTHMYKHTHETIHYANASHIHKWMFT